MRLAEGSTGGRRCLQLNSTREPTMLNKIFGIVVAAAVLALYGCNTVEGMGKDVERGGEKIQSGAEKTKAKM